MKRTTRIASLLAGSALALGLLAGVAPTAFAGGDHGDGARAQRADVDTSDWPQGKSLSDPDGGDPDKPNFGGEDGNNGCGNDEDREDDNNGNCGEESGGAEVSGDTDDADDACAAEAADADADDAGNQGAEVKSVATSHGDDHGARVSAVAKANDQADAAKADGADSDDCPDTDDGASVAGTTTRLEAAAGATVLGATEVAPTGTTTSPASTDTGTQVLGITETAPSTLARTGAGVGALALAGGLCLGGGRLTAMFRRRLGS